MRKITDMIVKGRYFFLSIFIIGAILSLYLSTKVNINDDIMKYLPKNSETKIGKDIMDKEFSKQDTSTLNVMFKNLTKKEKEETLNKLEKVDGVSSITYENNSYYNKDNYTLYIVNVNDYADSKTSTKVYEYIKDNFKTSGMSGTIYDENKPILKLWVVILAIACSMIILTILSESYLEPWLYLISIGIAVFINKGTNIMFESVSSITNSIVAILQLALSMDYSIMLSNRYKQEKQHYKNKIDAMKEALYHSFSAISSSSLTTIVGLLALVFMSFTIGKDLGYVLAKGVLLSLLSIFFCLPALLLIFDNLIEKTHKKTPKFNLNKLGNIVYKIRYIQAIAIIILFLSAYLLKGNINILYTGSEQDKVGKIFPATNQIAIVYANEYEDLISSICKDLENDKEIDQVLCYSNTINEKLAYDELNNKFKELGQNTEIDEYLLKIIYYNYYNKDNNTKMTINEFISFIKSDIYQNNNFNNKIDNQTKNNIELLTKFTTKEEINKKRTIKELSNILGINENDATKILIYYNSKNTNIELTIKDFIYFILNDVSKDKEYASYISPNSLIKIQQLQRFTNTNIINKKMNSEELSNIFSIDKNLIEQLLLFYRTTTNSKTTLTLNEFATFTLNISNNEQYKNLFDENTINSLKLLQTISNESITNQELDIPTMLNYLNKLGININQDTLTSLYIYYTGYNTNTTLTLNEFANLSINLSKNEQYKEFFNEESINLLQNIINLNKYYNTSLLNTNLYEMFKIDSENAPKFNYIITGDPNGTYTMTPLEFVTTILNNETIVSNLNENNINSLKQSQYIMTNTNTKYNNNDLSTILKQDTNTIKFIYGIYDYQNNQLKNISIKNIINFIYNNQNNNILSNYINNNIDKLKQAYLIINNQQTKYNYENISTITNTNIETNRMIYGLYDYNKEETKLTPIELTNHILNNINNELLKDKINKTQITELNIIKEVMNSTINNKKYNSLNLSKLLNIDQEKIKLIYSLYNTKYINKNEKISLYNYVNFITNNIMNNKEYSNKFDNTKRQKLNTIKQIMNNSLNNIPYTSNEAYLTLSTLNDDMEQTLIELTYMYYGSKKEYDESWKMTIEELVNYLNNNILTDNRFDNFIDNNKKEMIISAQDTINKSKKLLVSPKYSRIVLNTKYPFEEQETYDFIKQLDNQIGDKKDIYIVGNSPMAVEMSKSFNSELNRITIITMIFIFIVVAFTFKDLIIPIVLVLIIQTAVYSTMSVISLTGGTVYFIALLIVQAILMGATIDYAIVYTEYYRESRLKLGIKDSIINAYNGSINTIISSSTILIIVTLIVAGFSSAIAAKICETISQGTLASTLLILLVLPGILAAMDKFICRKNYYKEKKQNSK